MNYKDIKGVYLENIYEVQDNYLRLTFNRYEVEKIKTKNIMTMNYVHMIHLKLTIHCL